MKNKKPYLKDCLSNESEAVKSGIGKNIIPPPEKEPLWKLYLDKFKDPIIIVLLVVFFFSIVVAVYEIIYMGQSFIKKGLIWPLFYTGAFYLIFSGGLTVLFGKLEKKLDYFRG
jgi:magnesium-transporting ATPase (P-type)